MNVGFIGAGKVGCALGRYFAAGGIPVTGYASKRVESAERAAALTHTRAFPSAPDLVAVSDIIFLTVTDSAIADVWHDLCAQASSGGAHPGLLSGKIVCHCSGCASSTVLDNAADLGAHVASAHPLTAVSSPELPLEQLARTHVSIEGDPRAASTLGKLFADLGNPVHTMDAADKVRYHAAAVFASNLVLATLDTAERLMQTCGFSAADAREALSPLVRGNVDAFCDKGAQAALTGPVERNDLATVARHLEALDAAAPDDAALYRALTKTLARIAKEKHPDRDYAPLEAAVSA